MVGQGLHGRGLVTATLLSLRKAPGSPLSVTPGWDPLQSPVRSPTLQANSLPAEPPGKPQSITLGSRVSGPTSGGPVTLQMWSGRRKPLRTAGLGMLASRPSDNLLRAGLPRAFSVTTWLGPLRLGGPVFLPAEHQVSRVLRTLWAWGNAHLFPWGPPPPPPCLFSSILAFRPHPAAPAHTFPSPARLPSRRQPPQLSGCPPH